MDDLLHLTAAHVRRVPWKNGRGVTDELLVRPTGATFEAGDFDVRISRATVAASGPFSSFPGFDRILVVTAGAGLLLSHEGASTKAHVGRLEPYAFSGDDSTAATLLDGAVTDFNVITRRGGGPVEVRVIRPRPGSALEPFPTGDAFVHALVGTLDVQVESTASGGEHRVRLAPGESAFARDVHEGDRIDLGGVDVVAILVRIARRDSGGASLPSLRGPRPIP